MMVGGDEGIEADDSSGCLSLWANINNAVDIEDTVVDVADTAGASCGAFTPALAAFFCWLPTSWPARRLLVLDPLHC